jgi:hypothetical protein
MEYHVPQHEICKYSSEHARVVSSSLTLHCHVLQQSSGQSSLAIKPQHGMIQSNLMRFCTVHR